MRDQVKEGIWLKTIYPLDEIELLSSGFIYRFGLDLDNNTCTPSYSAARRCLPKET